MTILPCVQCKHFVPKPKDPTYEHGRCDKFLIYADIARKDEIKCGKNGKLFVEKDKDRK